MRANPHTRMVQEIEREARKKGALRNQVLACHGANLRVPAGFCEVTAPAAPSGPQALRVFAGPHTSLTVFSDPRGADLHCYLWGLAGHASVSRSNLPAWIAEQVTAGRVTALREAVGSYVALLDDRRTGVIRIISDVGGTRPFFVGIANQRLVLGGDVWPMAEAKWISPVLNYDAIAAWLRAGYDFTEGSLFSDVRLIEPGAITTFKGTAAGEVVYYTRYAGGVLKPTQDEFIDQAHDAVTRAFVASTRELSEAQLALSGGFDSRYLAALSVDHGLRLRTSCLADLPSESKVAADVAERLGLPLHIIPTDGSRWNAYDEPFHFAPSGFPISKQQTHLVAIRHPGLPCLNGFVGDALLRGPVDRLEDKLPSETTEEHAKVLQRAQNYKHTFARFDLIKPEVLRRCDERTLPACRRQVERYAHTANVFAAVMYLRRHRIYFGNNFVGHLGICEPLIPFANFELYQMKCQLDPACYKWETYEALLARKYPKLAGIPHNSKITNAPKRPFRRSRVTPRWAVTVLSAMLARGALPIFDARKTVPRLLYALHGDAKAEIVAMFAYRLYLLETKLRAAGIEMNWANL